MTFNWGLARKQDALAARAEIIRAIRNYFHGEGYLEVDTPLRIPAPAPESHIDAIPCAEWYLHTSPELAMKRLLAAGYGRLFQICRCWRDGERGNLHLPEFTMLEWYRADADYLSLMDECEGMITHVAKTAGYGERVNFRGHEFSLRGKWERISVSEAFERYTRCSVWDALGQGVFDELMVTEIEPRLGIERPTFIYDYPAELGALARLKPADPRFAERFELYIGGLELANAFSELNDCDEQLSRFVKEREFRSSTNKRVYPLPEPFLDELPHMPPSAGIALGIDRLVMVLLDAPSIDQVVAFTPEDL
jgi:elongation factor P--(R)-beta-lysine ligase